MRSILLKFFLIFDAKDLHNFSALLGKLNSFAHCTYFEECKPEERMKCPSFNASVFFKTTKESFKESIFFIFVSNNFEF